MLNAFVDVRESRNFEFKTGGGSYPVSVLPEVNGIKDESFHTLSQKFSSDSLCMNTNARHKTS